MESRRVSVEGGAVCGLAEKARSALVMRLGRREADAWVVTQSTQACVGPRGGFGTHCLAEMVTGLFRKWGGARLGCGDDD